jgi:WD40 repeat protein
MAHDVFISYSSKDKLVADAVCATLEAAKIRCWITPRDILPGLDWAESIEGAITKSKLLILIFSSYSNNSKQVSREISLAFNSEVTVIPFRIEDIEPKGAMKYYLLNTHWQDALTPPMENHIKKLVEIVSTFISKKIDDTSPALISQGEKPEDLEIKKGFIKKQNKKKLAIIFGVIGVIIVAAVITVLIKFPINKTEKLVGTATIETTSPATTAVETTSPATTAVETTAPEATTKGKIAFYSDRDGNYEIYTMNVDGSEQVRLTNNPADDVYPSFSPDGSKIAFTSTRDGNDEIYTMNVDGSEQVRLTNSLADDAYPSFSPNGSKIAFISGRDGIFEIYTMNVDGSNQKRLTKNIADDNFPCFSPDSSKIAFYSNRDGNWEIYIMNSDGSNQKNLTNNESDDHFSCFSPDGSKIAFISNRDGNEEIYIMNSDGSNQKNLTNNESRDECPCFSPDG